MSTAEATPQPPAESARGGAANRGRRQPRRPRGDRAPNPANLDAQSQSQSQSSSQSQPQPPQPQSGRRRGGGGGGGGGGAGRGRGGRDGSLAMRPASVAPPSVDPSSADVSGAEQGPSRQRQPRGGRSNRARENRTTTNGRAFGGQLTQDRPLQADATAFVPGQPSSSQDNSQRQRQQKRRLSKSTAPDIATRTHHDIDNGHYECAICTNEVLRNSKVWSCKTCWTVFHLTCIKKWSSNEGSAAAQQQGAQNGDLPPPRQWRCPGCNLPKDVLPKNYACWCEKEIEPRPLAGLPPHSCGNSCGKERVRKCPHPCQLTCHAGPCPPCTHMGPTQICFCGKHESTRRCLDTDYENGWSCGEICDDVMPCGEHNCSRPCHEGLCGACEVRVGARCYCGQVEKDILCCDRNDEKQSQAKHNTEDGQHVTEEWTGIFECTNPCNRAFDCGHHNCEKACHPQDANSSHCPRSPDLVTHCPCGKTSLSDISDKPRTSCKDPVPNCSKPCLKTLSCGHACEQLCHSGECRPCLKKVPISCRCGRTTSTTICHQGVEEAPQCMRMCRATLNCGRHACDERCCTGERKAAERLAIKRKGRPINSAPRQIDDGFEPEHICTRSCGRPLKCGNHVCEELCHKGPCGTCREAIFDEISCHCGRTTLQPPLPCGTQPPPCRHQCHRPKNCGHPQVQHNCHLDSERCPKCPFLVEKRCMCGKKNLKNIQCWLENASCGQVCGQKLKCGSHFCQKMCHRPGECEDADGRVCKQPCGKAKTVCEHPDENPCHAPFSCKEDKPCPHKIFVTCDCQAQKQEMKCNASKASEGNLNKSLACNDECARLERNRKLALALNIDSSSHVDGGDHIPYSAETLTLFSEHPKWSQNQEREFRVFAEADDEKRLRFKPMKARERQFIHHLAEDFGFDSESMDPEPHRHVLVFKSPRFVSAPNKILAECVRIRAAQRAAAGSAAASDSEATNKARANEVGASFNSYIITHPRFGLVVEEIRAEVTKVVPQISPIQFDIEFLPNEEVILKAMSRTLDSQALEQMLKEYKAPLANTIASKALGTLQLCHTDTSLNVTRRESDSTAGDGWSRVAAKGAAPKRLNLQNNVAGRNAFSALGGESSGKVTFSAKKKKQPVKVAEPVVDDWEAAEIAEEEKEEGEKEKVASGAVSGVSSGGEEDFVMVEAEDQHVVAVPEQETDGSTAQETSPTDAEEHEAPGVAVNVETIDAVNEKTPEDGEIGRSSDVPAEASA